MDIYPLWINGEPWDTGNYLTVTDKATGAPWATVSQAGAKEVNAAVPILLPGQPKKQNADMVRWCH